jgi:hypothetical protein
MHFLGLDRIRAILCEEQLRAAKSKYELAISARQLRGLKG